MGGWIKLHRCLQQSMVYGKPDYLSVWIHLLLSATHDDCDLLVGHQIVHLKSGQLCTGRKKISDSTGVSCTGVERVLNVLENAQQIGQQTFTKYRIITIVKWDEYQLLGQQTGQQADNKRTTSGHIQEVKKEKKEKKESLKHLVESSDSFSAFWDAYPKKVGKGDVEKIWNKLSPPIEKVLSSLTWQKVSRQWREGYIPNPSTYLNQKRWEDEPDVKVGLRSVVTGRGAETLIGMENILRRRSGNVGNQTEIPVQISHSI